MDCEQSNTVTRGDAPDLQVSTDDLHTIASMVNTASIQSDQRPSIILFATGSLTDAEKAAAGVPASDSSLYIHPDAEAHTVETLPATVKSFVMFDLADKSFVDVRQHEAASIKWDHNIDAQSVSVFLPPGDEQTELSALIMRSKAYRNDPDASTHAANICKSHITNLVDGVLSAGERAAQDGREVSVNILGEGMTTSVKTEAGAIAAMYTLRLLGVIAGQGAMVATTKSTVWNQMVLQAMFRSQIRPGWDGPAYEGTLEEACSKVPQKIDTPEVFATVADHLNPLIDTLIRGFRAAMAAVEDLAATKRCSKAVAFGCKLNEVLGLDPPLDLSIFETGAAALVFRPNAPMTHRPLGDLPLKVYRLPTASQASAADDASSAGPN